MKYNNFDFLKNTFWCVPERSTTALEYGLTPIKIPHKVQVVWNITDVINNEYIVGICYSKFFKYSISFLNAMINKDGIITMMFNSNVHQTDIFSVGTLLMITEINPPFPYEKQYVNLKLNHVFQMQVNLPVYDGDDPTKPKPNSFMLHNAYMVQATPQTDIWNNLPTTNNSIPTFIAEAEVATNKNNV